MAIRDCYLSFDIDLSGSVTKNRFRNELLWGLNKAFEEYTNCCDFTVVFDYACDIEIHKEKELFLYQVKTQKPPKAYPLSKLISIDSKKNKSILSDLYKNKIFEDSAGSILVSVVSNQPFLEESTLVHEQEIFSFSDLSPKNQEKVCNNIKKILGEEINPSLKDIFFTRSFIDLYNPSDVMLGKTVKFFYEQTGKEVKKPNSLYAILEEAVQEKACYELPCDNYDKVLDKKGISRLFLTKILEQYGAFTDEAVKRTTELIKRKVTAVGEKIKYIKAVSFVRKHLVDDCLFIEAGKQVYDSIKVDFENFAGDEWEMMNHFYPLCRPLFHMEITDTEVKAFILLLIKKYEEEIENE